MSLHDGEERLNQEDFDVKITSQSVNVRLNASRRAPLRRFYWAAVFVALGLAALCLLLFVNGKNGQPAMWRYFTTNPIMSTSFIIPALILLGCSTVMVLISWRYVVMAFPSDETFYCDRSQLTISKVRWLDIRNNTWRTRSFPLREVKGFQYRSVARARGASVYGFRFTADGRSERILPGIGNRHARSILKAVASLGVEVDE